MLRLFVFLGNPGREYARTRHNAAWMVADGLSFSGSLDWQKKFKGDAASFRLNGEALCFLKPGTFMNLSGESVQAALSFYKLTPGEVMVVHDDLELPFGIAGVRYGGGLAGHNGLRSIARSLGTPDFGRFRIGISRPSRGDVSAWVLGRFSPEEEVLLPGVLGTASRLLESCMGPGGDAVIGRSGKVSLL